MSSDSREIEEWLHQLAGALTSISAPDRDNILRETRSHLRELISTGVPPAAALARFGSAEEYAQRFVQEIQMEGVLRSRDTRALLHVVTSQEGDRVTAMLALIGIAALGVLALVSAITLLFKIFDPVHAWVWRGTHGFFLIGIIADPTMATELLGIWLYPLCIGGLALSWLSARMLLLWAATRIVRSRSAALPR